MYKPTDLIYAAAVLAAALLSACSAGSPSPDPIAPPITIAIEVAPNAYNPTTQQLRATAEGNPITAKSEPLAPGCYTATIQAGAIVAAAKTDC